MADFKTALHALARGDLDYEVVALNVVKLLKKKPHAAASMLEQLRDAYNDGLLDADNFARLKKQVLDIAAPPDSTYVVVPEDGDNPDSIAAEARAAALAAQPQRVSTIDFDLSGDSQPSTGSSWDDMGSGPSAAGTGWSRDDAVASQKIEPGSTLKGRFALDEVLGVGGMGTVYKGRDLIKVEAKDRNPWVALKVLNEDFKKHPDSFIALQREASRQQKLAHPNIATVYDFDRTEDGTVFLTMELLEGTPLNTFIKKEARPRGGLPFAEAFPIIQGLGNALVYAHERNIVHSDFKPGNCFVTNDDTMKVLDFGIARAVKNPGQGDGEKTLFDPGELGALTPAYASPEMLEQKEPDPRDDIYALACVAYELLTGKHPFNKLPADKARDNGLSPPQVKGLKRRQLRGLQRGLAFTRDERSQSVAQFIEELEGHSSPFRNPFIMVPAVAAVVVIATVFPVKNYLEEQHIHEQIRLAESGDPAAIAGVLEALPQLDFADQGRILVEAREPILGFYEARIRQAVDLDNRRYDFQGAEQVLYEVKQLGAPEPAAPGTYSDSSKVGELDDWLKEQFALAESNLVTRFNAALENGALLPEDGADDIHDIRSVVEKIDPNHPLLRDPRLPGVFDAAITTSIAAQDFERGARLASTGRELLPGNRNLINLADKVTASRDKAERDAIVAARTAAIGEIDDRYRTLAGYLPVQDDIVALAEIAPSHPVVEQLAGTLRPLVEAEVNALSRTGAWGASQLLGADFGPLLKATGLRELDIRVNRLRGRYGDDIFNIVTAVTGAVADGRLEEAEAELGKLEDIAAGQPSTARARQQVARAYLRQARSALADGDADSAAQTAERAAQLDPDDELSGALETVATGIASGTLPEVAPGTVEALAADLDQKIPAINSAADAAAALAVLDRLEAARPNDPRTVEYRARVAERAAEAGATLGQEGDWSDAIALVETTLAFVPESTELAGSLVQFQDGLKAANAAAEARFIDEARTRVATLLDQPTFDRDWNTALETTLADIEDLVAPDDEWLAQAKSDVAAAYIQQSITMREDERFAESASLLDRAARYAPELAGIGAQRELLASAEEAFNEAQREAQNLARIEALKQTFLTQTRARQVAGAARSLEQLRSDLPENDPFIVSEAPAALASAYSRLAASKAEVQDFAAALKLAKAGLKENPDSVTLQRQVKEYNIKGTKQEINNSLATSGAIDLAGVLEQIADLKKFDPVEYSREQDRWASSLKERITRLRDADPAASNAALSEAQSVFEGNPVLAALEPIDLGSAQPSEYAADIRAAIEAAQLTSARDLLKSASATEAEHPDIVSLKGAYNSRLRDAKALYEDYKTQFRAREFEAANGVIDEALELWSDSNIFRREKARVLAALDRDGDGIAPGASLLPPPPSKSPCEAGLAGFGKRKKGTCFDMIAGKARGPLMVVVPPGGTFNAPFAIGKYEVTVGDYSRYCKLSGTCSAIEGDASMPITGISFDEARAYVKWLSTRTGNAYRIPRAAEWAYAADAGGQQPKKDFNCRVEQGGQVLKGQSAMGVNTGKANGWGLYNYVGNAQEWVLDGDTVVARGGAFADTFSNCDIGLERRHDGKPDPLTGFRVVMDL